MFQYSDMAELEWEWGKGEVEADGTREDFERFLFYFEDSELYGTDT